MASPHDDSVAAYRSAARSFMSDLRKDVRDWDLRGSARVPMLVDRVAQDAGRAAGAWPTREQRRRFLIELAGEARSEWTVQAEPDGPAAQFYAALRERLGEMSRA